MKFSHWPSGDYPIYINPDFGEIVELAKTKPDTLRIIEGYDNQNIAIASGYGNTHDSVVKGARVKLENKRWSGFDYILYREAHEWFWNPMWHWPTESERVPVFEPIAIKHITNQLEQAIRDFVQVFGDF